MIAKSIAAVLDATALRYPSRRALVSPFQSHEITYDELRDKTNALAGYLRLYGYERSDVLVSDLPNVTENIIMQIACNRLGVIYGTPIDLESMAKFPKVKGAVSATSSGFLAETNLPFPYLGGDFLEDAIHNGGLADFENEEFDQEGREDALELTHAVYRGQIPYTNEMAIRDGQEAAEELLVIEEDTVCIATSLHASFGMGFGVCSVIERGGCIVLPAAGGMQGGKSRDEQASAVFDVLESEKCELIVTDADILDIVPDEPLRVNLRGGVCKIASGSTWLPETRKYGGISLKTMG